MSSLEDFGGCLWKLFQLGVVVAILALGLLFIARPQKEAEAKGVDVAGEQVKKQKTGLIAKLRNAFGGKKDEEGKLAEEGAIGEGEQGGGALMKSQKDIGTGHVELETLLGLMDDENVKKEIELLAEGTTQIEQILFWQVISGNVYYRIVLRPYDRKAHEMMMQPREALFMSFRSGDNKRLVPRSADFRIDMRNLRVATGDGYAVGWFFDGYLPLAGVKPEMLERGKVGWIFSSGLHARLQLIQAPKRPVDNTVTEPFSIDIPMDEQGGGTGQ